jgi:DNA-binding transcriptional regulator YdaS (Cro superfamily)
MTLRAYLKVKRGRTTLLAKALGVSVAIVSMWANKQRRIPAEQCNQISRITGVPMRSLRRDLFGKS